MVPGNGSRRSPVAFFALVGILAAPFWVLGSLVGMPKDSPIRLPVSALWFLTPIVAASILSFREASLAGVRDLLQRTIDPQRLPPARIVAVVAFSPATYLAFLGIASALGRPVATPTVAIPDLVILAGLYLLVGVTEEGGWSAYASEPLRERYGEFVAAVLLGAVWGLGHVIPDRQAGRGAGWIFWQRAVAGIALRILMVRVMFSGGGVAAVVLLHAVDDLSWHVSATAATYDPMIVGLLLSGAAAVAVFVPGLHARLVPQLPRPTGS
jgi:hypothetical protein